MIFCLPIFCLFDSQPIMLGESACKSSLNDYYDDLKNIMRKFKKTTKGYGNGNGPKKRRARASVIIL